MLPLGRVVLNSHVLRCGRQGVRAFRVTKLSAIVPQPIHGRLLRELNTQSGSGQEVELLAGWTANDTTEVPRFYKLLKGIRSGSVKLPAAPEITPHPNLTVFTPTSYYTCPDVNSRNAVDAAFPLGSNETYETYGSGAWDCIIAEILCKKFKHLHSDGITTMSHYLIRSSTLAVLSTAYTFPNKLRQAIKQPPPSFFYDPVEGSHLVAAGIFKAYIWALRTEKGHPATLAWLEPTFLRLAQPLYTDLGGKGNLKIDSESQYTVLRALEKSMKVFS